MAKRFRINFGKPALYGSHLLIAIAFGFCALFFAILALFSYLELAQLDELNARQGFLVAEQRILTQQMRRSSQEAVSGEAETLDQLRTERQRFQAALVDLTQGIDLTGGHAAGQALDEIVQSSNAFAEGLSTLIAGVRGRDEAAGSRKALEEMTEQFATLETRSTEILRRMDGVRAAIGQLPGIQTAVGGVESALSTLLNHYREAGRRFILLGLPIGNGAVLLFAAFSLLSLAALVLIFLSDSKTREAAYRAQTERDEHAILRLLDELGDLADGDLTVEATVTEDKTGAIADAFNYAIEALRGLVATINQTATQVAGSAQESRSISLRLAEASSAQSLQITQASAAVQSLTVQIDEVARNAGESAEVASRSVEVAGRGAQTVRDTIQGMDAIREQIQETSKRIKRLGESSQEIGEIVELIDDIADQTNILALNAAMQAAMAGEAGRGFAVVADEVRKLAERTGKATGEITEMIKGVQQETQEAVQSMESGIKEVDQGREMVDKAGNSLTEIVSMSQRVMEMIQQMATASEQQSAAAEQISKNIENVSTIARESATGAEQSAAAAEELNRQAESLKNMVAQFRLA